MDSRLLADRVTRHVFFTLTALVCLVMCLLAAVLWIKSMPAVRASSIGAILFTSEWSPEDGKFGLLPYIAGTVSVTFLAMLMAVPVSILSAVYLAEYAPRWVRAAVLPVMDVLGGIPSIVYGVVGVLVVVPAVGKLSELFGLYATGYSLLSGGIVLAVMVSPFIISVGREVLSTVPDGLREASLSLGATKWQTIKHVVMRRARIGMAAAIMLGFSRAFGETIAVLMVVGNVAQVPRSLFDPAYPLPALMANKYGEMMSVPLYDSALLFSAFVLLVVVLMFNALARVAMRMLG